MGDAEDLSASTHDGTRKDVDPQGRMTPLPSIALTLACSVCGAVLLEAMTVFGTFTHHLFDPTSWSKKRLLVFFVISLAVVLLVKRHVRLRRSPNRKEYPVPERRKMIASAIAVISSIVLGMLFGGIVGGAMGHPADGRYGIVLSTALTTISLLAINARLIASSAEWGFVAIAVPATICSCLIMPTAAEVSWDGQIHFNSANAISYLTNAEYTGADRIMTKGGAIGGALYLTEGLDPSGRVSLRQDLLARSANNLLKAESSEPVVEMQGTSRYESSTWLGRTTVGWIPNAFGLWLGRVVRADCITRYTLGRLANSLFYCLVFFFAIRRLKRGKLIASAIGLFPTSLIMAANYSYDPWVTCLVAYSFCRFVGVLQGPDKMTISDAVAIGLSFFFGALVKAVIFPLAFAFFLVPKEKFETKRIRFGFDAIIACSICGVLMSFALPFVINLFVGTHMGDARGGSNVDSGSQVRFILSQPVHVADEHRKHLYHAAYVCSCRSCFWAV
jgi:hypothetical protein